MSARLRRAGPDDAEAIASVHIDAWRAAYVGLVPAGYLGRLDVHSRAERWRAKLAEHIPRSAVFVAEDGDEVQGFAVAGPLRAEEGERAAADEGEVYALYVAPAVWRQGLGAQLLGEAERFLWNEGLGQGRLWVLAANHPARHLYEAHAWKADGATADLDLDAPVAAVRYAKTLQAR